MKVLEAEFLKDFLAMCEDAWNLGWHEYHAGNLTYRMKQEETDAVREELSEDGTWKLLPVKVPSLAEEFFLVTAGGSSFHGITGNAEKLTGILQINSAGDAFRVCWGLKGREPTSEFPAHLMNHAIKKEVSGGTHRIIYHAHPANLIALSFILPLEDRAFTRELWEMEPECAMTFPDGIGVLPWVLPGSEESAEQTGEKMKEYDIVLWAYHGAFASGRDFDSTMGLMHTVEKASEILVKVLSMSPVKKNCPTAENLIEMEKPFRLKLPRKFL